jgi:hypothetical protein
MLLPAIPATAEGEAGGPPQDLQQREAPKPIAVLRPLALYHPRAPPTNRLRGLPAHAAHPRCSERCTATLGDRRQRPPAARTRARSEGELPI